MNSSTQNESECDPVQILLRSARDDVDYRPFHVTGVMVQYYKVCKRELWFVSRDIEIDRDNPGIVQGTKIDESAYAENRRNVSIDTAISIDVLQDGRILEVKPSSSMTEPAKFQLLYYLWYLENIAGVQKEGVLAHPTERKREQVELTPENTERIENVIRGIYRVIRSDTPPPAEEKPYCETCAYFDFCWSC